MNRMRFLSALLIALFATSALAHEWIRPEGEKPVPLWGHADGIRVGLYPMRGPRGLLRIYTPYAGQPDQKPINFIAVEPIVAGQRDRGLSELEPSKLDKVPGKRFWSVDDPKDSSPRPADHPVRGQLETIDGIETLRVWIAIEPFDNGAHVQIRVTFCADRPHEVALAAFDQPDSKPLDRCVFTATMGNFARLRDLKLADETVSSLQLWPDYSGDGFAPHKRFPLSKLQRARDGAAIASAAPDEKHPANVPLAPGTPAHWKYVGRPARQYWRSDRPDPDLLVWVNGRFMYWRSDKPLPGGIAFENFEMVSPFHSGEDFWFGVEPIGQ
jgi:hypothetical protein